MSETLQGRRLPDTKEDELPLLYGELKPGDYWKLLDCETGEPVVVNDRSTNLTKTAWWVMFPSPDGRMLIANLRAHTVREHEDGTISVRPGDGSSNSILVGLMPDMGWHGYIEKGIFRSC